MFKSQVLHIKLLGGFDLRLGESSLTGIIPERLQFLLAYLVLHRQVLHPRQQLSSIFWPDSTASQALTNLRRAIYDLRRILPDVEQLCVSLPADSR